MRITKAMTSLTLAAAIIASPVVAHAAPKSITIMPGDAITIPWGLVQGTCTAAAPARDAKGNRYLLTAGHCVYGKIGEILSKTIVYKGQPIGYIANAAFGSTDYAVIRLLPNVKVGNNDVPHYAYLNPVKRGERICFHGTKSGISCGTVTANNVNALMRGSLFPAVVQVTSARMHSISGDSGSAVYSSKGVVGILSGGRDGITSYVPMKNIYRDASPYLRGFRISD